jgi:radical SAM superfamily enzyme YgiQ (UPF0313 family)
LCALIKKRKKGTKAMRVLLISANTEPINMPIIPLGLGCVAEAVRREGHEVELVDLMCVSDARSVIKDSIERFGPDVIGISVRNLDAQRIESPIFLLDKVRDVIADCRAFSDARIVIGGVGYSIFPESALAYLAADMGIQGEGEIAFPSLLARMEKGADIQGIPGLYLPDQGVQDKRRFAKNSIQYLSLMLTYGRLPLPGIRSCGCLFKADGDV